MRKVVVIHLGVDGAGPVYSLEMARALFVCGAKVLCIISRWTENLQDWLDEEKKGIWEVMLVDSYTSKKNLIQKSVNISKFLSIYLKIRKFGANVVYSPMSDLWQPVIFSLFIPRRVMRIKTIHDVIPHKGENSFLLRLYHRFSYKHAEKYVILSHLFKEHLKNKGIASQNIIVIPHANFDYYHAPTILPSFKYHNRILFFGRIISYKGLDILLKAMKIVLETNPTLELLIAGSGDIKEYEMDFHELESNLVLKLYKIPNEEVAGILSQVDFVVLPYTDASQSGVIPLAYSFGKPVIASSIGGIPEQVDDKVGILVEPGNVKMLADEIAHLSLSPQRIEIMSKCAKMKADTMTWKNSAQILLNNI